MGFDIVCSQDKKNLKKMKWRKHKGGLPPRDITWDIMTFSGELLGQKPVLSYVSICYHEFTSLPTNPALWHGPLQLRRSVPHPLSLLWWNDGVHIQALISMSLRAQRHAETPKKKNTLKKHLNEFDGAQLNAGTQSSTEVSYETVWFT